jgi:hypothetical protein
MTYLEGSKMDGMRHTPHTRILGRKSYVYVMTATLQTDHKEVVVARVIHRDSNNLTGVSSEGDIKIRTTNPALKPI